MLQVYFFSSALLVICGIVVSHQKFGDLLKYDFVFNEKLLENKKFNVVVAILTIFFSILLILKSSDFAVIGDIIPALLGIIGGVSLLFRSFNKQYSGKSKFLSWCSEFIKANIAIMGVVMIILGIVHAIFPTVILL